MIIAGILFIFIFSFTFLSFFCYPLVISLLSRKASLESSPQAENITVVVPVINEEKFIERKLENLLSCSYPQCSHEIIVVDSGSEDNTVALAQKYPVTIYRSQRGKINALNEALKHAKSDIIVATDADTIIEKDSIRSLVSYLHGTIGAACGFPHLKTSDKNLFYLKSRQKYYTADWNQRYSEGLVDSACSLDGKLIAFRKSIISEFPGNYLSDDYVLTLITRKKGYRCIVDKDAKVYEEVPDNVLEEIKQIRRRSAIGIYTTLGFSGMVFNPAYALFGLLIFPFRRFFPLFSPLLILYMLVYLFALSTKAGLIVMFGSALPLLLFKGPYFFIQLIGISLAWIDVIMGKARRHDLWKKIKS
jgi:cellulose synthase/poly-beta-1,6-N-acetylglucosamine synthase-like glycosyltransferase